MGLNVTVHKLDPPVVAGSKPTKSSKVRSQPYCALDMRTKTVSAADIALLFMCFLFLSLTPFSLHLFLVASQVRKLQEGFPVHLDQMSVWCYEQFSILSKLICVDFCMEKK